MLVAMTTVFAILRPRPERADELERELLALARSTAAEPGARAYSVSRTDDHQFLVFERYADPPARDAHFAAPYLTALLARFPDLLESEPQVVFGAELKGAWTRPDKEPG